MEFGAFTTWVAYLSIGFILGSIAQFAANFLPLKKSVLISMALMALAAQGIALFALMYIGAMHESVVLATLTVLSATTFMWFLGQIQAQLRFYVVGGLLLLTAFLKLGTVGVCHWLGFFDASFYWSYFVSFSAPLVVILIYLALSPKSEINSSSLTSREVPIRLGSTVLLAAAATMIPQVDILIAHQLLDPTELGTFSRVSLLYKAMFFGLFIFAQWLLPHQIRNESINLKSLKMTWAIAGLGVALSVVATAIGPTITELLLQFSLSESRVWILLSCLNMSFLIATYFLIQMECSSLHLKTPALVTASIALAYLAFSFWVSSMTPFLIAITSFNGFVFLAFQLQLHRQARRPSG